MSVDFPRISKLASEMSDPRFRASYFVTRLKMFVADQIRALRGHRSQAEFGRMIGKPQSVVSRLENETYGQVALQTLIDIANKIDVALLIRFVDWPTFLRATSEFTMSTIAPRPYAEDAIEAFARESDANVPRSEFMRLFAAPVEQSPGNSVLASLRSRPLHEATSQAASEAARSDAENRMHQPPGRWAA